MTQKGAKSFYNSVTFHCLRSASTTSVNILSDAFSKVIIHDNYEFFRRLMGWIKQLCYCILDALFP